jgi:fructose-bisphosphate aldolase class I
MDTEQFNKIKNGKGLIAALDHGVGSTPQTLRFYGVDDAAYANLAEMFDLVHDMRTRVITSPVFTGDRILGTVLFQMTVDREIGGKGAAEYLWEDKNIVPFVKIDQGLAHEVDGAQLMKPMPGLTGILDDAKTHGVFGTKMRSFIKLANEAGVQAVVDQQFEVGRQILDAGLVPIIEPEIDIHSPEKSEAETLLKTALLRALDGLDAGQQVMLKLTLPEEDGYFTEFVHHPHVLRVFALSGGYTRANATTRLARHHGVAANFSRALMEGLSIEQSEADFEAALETSIRDIYEASTT